MSLWVQLGRSGDILNILPLLYHDAAAGRRQSLMVAKDYAGLLEGVSYVDPVIFDGGAQELERAVDEAHSLDEKVICTQVNGPIEAVRKLVYTPAGQDKAVTTSYQKEMWKVAGRLKDWGTHPELPNSQLPLVFDKRNSEREAKLLLSHLPRGSKKIVLVAADGISSPFPCKQLLLELLRARKYFPIDLGSIHAERLFDLLAFYERAFALVAIDSAPLHLANAVPSLPVVALVNDKPILWNGSSWRANHVAYCRYSDFVSRAVELLDALDGYRKPEDPALSVTHVYNALEETEPMTAPDKNWNFLPIRPGMVGRLDSDGHPLLKDCLRMALQRARNGWVVLSRPGLQLSKDIAEQIKADSRQAYAYRMNQEGGRCHFSHVLDLFAAPAKWWRDNLDSIPELHLNRDYFWSQALWALFRADVGRDLTGIVERVSSEHKAAAKDMPESTKKNADAAGKLYGLFKMTKRFPRISEQAEIQPLKGEALEPGGYNPSIAAYPNGELLMVYRYHPEDTLNTKLAAAQISLPKFEVTKAIRLTAGEKTSIDDPRLFHGPANKIWCSFVDGTWPEIPPKCQVRVGMFDGPEIKNVITPKIGRNDGTTIEKNWIFWYDEEQLYCLYETSPEHVVFFDDKRLTCPGPVWPYGVPRGGTMPLEHGDHYLRFFHSSVRNEFISSPHRYFVGAYLMKKEPPFEVVSVSRKPILYGSEMDEYKVKERPHHWKPNVIFPAGVLVVPGGWLLSCGVNDAACALVKITPEMLNL